MCTRVHKALEELSSFLHEAYCTASATADRLEAIVESKKTVVRDLEKRYCAPLCKENAPNPRCREDETQETVNSRDRLDEVLAQAQRIRKVSLSEAKKRRPVGKRTLQETTRSDGKPQTVNNDGEKRSLECTESAQPVQSSQQVPPVPQVPAEFRKAMHKYERLLTDLGPCEKGMGLQGSTDTFIRPQPVQECQDRFLSKLEAHYRDKQPNNGNEEELWTEAAALVEAQILLMKIRKTARVPAAIQKSELPQLWKDVCKSLHTLQSRLVSSDDEDVVFWRNRALRTVLSTAKDFEPNDTPGVVPVGASQPPGIWLPEHSCAELGEPYEDLFRIVRNPSRTMKYTKDSQLEALMRAQQQMQQILFYTFLESKVASKLLPVNPLFAQQCGEGNFLALMRLAHRFLCPPKSCSILKVIEDKCDEDD